MPWQRNGAAAWYLEKQEQVIKPVARNRRDEAMVCESPLASLFLVEREIMYGSLQNVGLFASMVSLLRHNVPGIFGVDTRAITKRLRMEGSKRCELQPLGEQGDIQQIPKEGSVGCCARNYKHL